MDAAKIVEGELTQNHTESSLGVNPCTPDMQALILQRIEAIQTEVRDIANISKNVDQMQKMMEEMGRDMRLVKETCFMQKNDSKSSYENQRHQGFLQKNHTQLLGELHVDGNILLDNLMAQRVITESDRDIIIAETGKKAKTRKLLDRLRQSDSEKFDSFVSELAKTQPCLATSICECLSSFSSGNNSKTCVKCLLKRNVPPNDVADELFQNGVLSGYELEYICDCSKNINGRWAKLLDKIVSQNEYNILIRALCRKHPNIMKELDKKRDKMSGKCQCEGTMEGIPNENTAIKMMESRSFGQFADHQLNSECSQKVVYDETSGDDTVLKNVYSEVNSHCECGHDNDKHGYRCGNKSYASATDDTDLDCVDGPQASVHSQISSDTSKLGVESEEDTKTSLNRQDIQSSHTGVTSKSDHFEKELEKSLKGLNNMVRNFHSMDLTVMASIEHYGMPYPSQNPDPLNNSAASLPPIPLFASPPKKTKKRRKRIRNSLDNETVPISSENLPNNEAKVIILITNPHLKSELECFSMPDCMDVNVDDFKKKTNRKRKINMKSDNLSTDSEVPEKVVRCLHTAEYSEQKVMLKGWQQCDEIISTNNNHIVVAKTSASTASESYDSGTEKAMFKMFLRYDDSSEEEYFISHDVLQNLFTKIMTTPGRAMEGSDELYRKLKAECIELDGLIWCADSAEFERKTDVYIEKAEGNPDITVDVLNHKIIYRVFKSNKARFDPEDCKRWSKEIVRLLPKATFRKMLSMSFLSIITIAYRQLKLFGRMHECLQDGMQILQTEIPGKASGHILVQNAFYNIHFQTLGWSKNNGLDLTSILKDLDEAVRHYEHEESLGFPCKFEFRAIFLHRAMVYLRTCPYQHLISCKVPVEDVDMAGKLLGKIRKQYWVGAPPRQKILYHIGKCDLLARQAEMDYFTDEKPAYIWYMCALAAAAEAKTIAEINETEFARELEWVEIREATIGRKIERARLI